MSGPNFPRGLTEVATLDPETFFVLAGLDFVEGLDRAILMITTFILPMRCHFWAQHFCRCHFLAAAVAVFFGLVFLLFAIGIDHVM